MAMLAVDNSQHHDRRIWNTTALALLAGIAAFGFAFRTESVRAFSVWNESTAYNHCYLIVPITAYLIWERWQALVACLPRPSLFPLIAMLPAGLAWLVAAQIGVMEGRQLAAVTLFELYVMAVLGFRTWRIIGFALLYLYFLVPFGAFLTPHLQDFAARFAVRCLEILDIPVFFDPTASVVHDHIVHEPGAQVIYVRGGAFDVVEACAGLRFLIASVALATLYGYMMYRSWVRRAVFILASIVISLIANGLRILGLVLLGNYLGSAQAAVADHLTYGWVFFSMVSVVLILLGLPFREDLKTFPVGSKDGISARTSMASLLTATTSGILIMIVLASPVVRDGLIARSLGDGLNTHRQALHKMAIGGY